MKKILSFLLILILAFSFIACQAVKDEAERMMPDSMDGNVNNNTTNDNSGFRPGIAPDQPTGSIETPEFKVSDDMPCVSEYSKYSDTLYGYGFSKSEKGVVPSIGFYKTFLKDVNAVYVDESGTKNIYLTFDEGYENGFTGAILDTLKAKKVPAAFFCTGDYLKRNNDLVKRMIDEGHIVGNHTWNHKSMPKVETDEEFKDELKKIDDYLNENFNYKVKYFRYPNGEFSEKSLARVNDMGYKTVFWSVAYKDWEKDVTKGTEHAVNEVCNHIHNGAIILLHAVSKDNSDALGRIIDTLRNEGYEFKSLDSITF